MDWTGAIGLIGAVVGATGTTWAIVSDRSRMRTIERSADLLGKLPKGSDALTTVKALMDDVAADLLRAYRNPSSGRWQSVVGAILALLGVVGLVAVALGTRGRLFRGTGDWSAIGLMMLSVSVFTAGYALMFLAVVNRRRHRLRQRTRAEMENYKAHIVARMQQDRWRPRRRKEHARRLREVEADIREFEARFR